MTGPRPLDVSWLTGSPASTTAPTDPPSTVKPLDLSWMGIEDDDDKRIGFFEHWTRFARGAALAMAVKELGLDQASPQEITASQYPDMMKKAALALKAGQDSGDGLTLALLDFASFFGELGPNSKEKMKELIAVPGMMASSLAASPVDFLGDLGVGLTMPLSDLAESILGVNMTSGEEAVAALDPDQRKDRIKNAVATAVAFGVGAGVGRAFATGEVNVTRKLMAQAADMEKRVLSTQAAGQLAKRGTFSGGMAAKEILVKGTAVGVGSGFAYGGVRYANEEEQLNEMILNGIIFAPLGWALDMVGLPGKRADYNANTRSAGHIARLHAVQDLIGNTTFGIQKQLELFKTSESMLSAIQEGIIDVPHGGTILLHDMPYKGVVTEAANPNTRHAVHLWSDSEGKTRSSVLFVDKTMPGWDLATLQFGREGYFASQAITVNGRDHIYVGGVEGWEAGSKRPEKVKVIDVATGKVKVVDRSTVSAQARGTVDPYVHFNTPISIKGKFINEIDYWDDARETPTARLAQRAIAKSMTGTPISVIGFRVKRLTRAGASNRERRTGVTSGLPTTGRFYTSDPQQLAFYFSGKGYDVTNTPHANKSFVKAVKDRLIVQEITFKNPLVVNGQQFSAGEALKKIFHDRVASNKSTPDWIIRDIDYLNKLEKPVLASAEFGKEVSHALMDTVIARLAKEAGFDGIIMKQRSTDFGIGAQIVDLMERPTIDRRTAKSKITAIRTAKETQDSFVDKLYRDFKYEILDKTGDEFDPTKSPKAFELSLSQYLDDKGIDPVHSETLRTEFHKRLANELVNENLLPEDKEFFGALLKRADEMEEQRSTQKFKENRETAASLADLALNSNKYIDVEDAGGVTIRDLDTGRALATGLKTSAQVKEFLAIAGGPGGVKLNIDIAPPMIRPPAPHGSGSFEPDPAFRRGRVHKFFDTMNVMLDFITPRRDVFGSYDSKFNIDVFNPVYDKTQQARKRAYAVMQPHMRQVKELADGPFKGMDEAEIEMIGNYLRSRDATEIASGLGMGRPLTALEQTIANKIASNNVDLTNVFEFNKSVEKLLNDFEPGDPKIAAKVAELRSELGIDDLHLEVADMFAEIATMDRRYTSAGEIARLARALKSGETRAQFAARSKMTPKQIDAANQVEKLWKMVEKEQGFNRDVDINNVLTHARLYHKGNILKAVDDFGFDKATRERIEAMARTHSLSAYDMSPLDLVARNIKAGFDVIHFQDAFNEAKKAGIKAVKHLQERELWNTAESVKDYIERYLDELQGYPGLGTLASQEAVDALFDELGWKGHVNVRKDIVDFISVTGESAAQGFKLHAGIRDLYAGVKNVYGWFGAQRAFDVVHLGTAGLKNASAADLALMGIKEATPAGLETAGVTSGLDVVEYSSAAEREARLRQASNVAGRVYQFAKETNYKIARVGLKFSGQKDVYKMLQAGSFLAAWKNAGDNLMKFANKEIDARQLAKNTGLTAYELPVRNEFMRLVLDGKTAEAAVYLGQQAGYKATPIYGLANHPQAFGTNFGKMMAQFGNWPRWYLGQMMELVSYGSVGERAARLARWTVMEQVMITAGAAAGFNLTSWGSMNALAYRGGPLVDTWDTISGLMSGNRFMQKQAADRIGRWFPGMSDDGEKAFIGHIWLPGSYAAQGFYDAGMLAKRGFNPLVVVGRGLGLPANSAERSLLDRFLGEYPNLIDPVRPKDRSLRQKFLRSAFPSS